MTSATAATTTTLLLLTTTFLASSLATFASAASLLNPVDFLALQAIRKSLEDMPGSGFFVGWDFTSDPCSFQGVLCSGDRVVSLSLGDPRAGSPGLIGRLHPALGRLSALTELSLAPGRVMGSIPGTVSHLRSLRFLALSRNFLSGPIPHSLSSLPSLLTLDLSYNSLSGTIPPMQASPLINLLLCHNHLSGKVPPFHTPDGPSSSPSSTLVRLDLKHNNLSGRIPSSLPNSLRYLSMSANQLEGSLGFLSNLANLNYLDLSMNRFAGVIPPSVFSLPLTTLKLHRNALTGFVVPREEVGIGTVDLSYNKLTGMVSPMLASVQSLYLNNNKFTGEVPRRIVERLMTGGGSGGIRTLYLQHNFLTGIEIDPTAELPTRAELCLQYNCMVPPLQTPCPLKAGTRETRPVDQCFMVWRKG